MYASLRLRRVSIQLLFLFNKEVAKELKKEILFQYSFCSYSTGNAPKISLPNVSFNTASVLIQQSLTRMRKEISLVSIQLLFLFNTLFAKKTSIGFCFNTASVLIQRRYLFSASEVVGVSIQLLFLFNVKFVLRLYSQWLVSIQLLFLFNWIFLKTT